MADEPNSESIPSLPAPRPPDEDDPPGPANDGTDGPAGVPADVRADVPADGERRWSVPSLLVLGLAVAVLAGAVVYHLGTVFLSVAPSNPVSQRYSAEINQHVLPEFEQNWQLFAPNPLQDDITVEARVQTLDTSGRRADSPWIDLTAHDFAAIRGNPAPSHIDQNLLRRAWDYYTSWHSQQDESSTGFGGPLSVEYLKRIALQRIGRSYGGERIIQIQFRGVTTPLTGPGWTGAPATATPTYRQLAWWPANDEDYQNLGVA